MSTAEMAKITPSPRMTILRDVSASSVPDAEEERIEFKALAEAIRRGQIGRYLWRFDDARLLTHSLEALNKPLLTSLLLRVVSRGDCYIEDQKGERRTVTVPYLVRLLGRWGWDWMRKGALVRRIRGNVEALWKQCEAPSRRRMNGGEAPVYLRTDLIFGLRSGGSVGHIAGVLNHLGDFMASPLFVTTDRIPTVRDDIETLIIRPSGRFRDFVELPSLDFNETLQHELRERLVTRKLAFFYQRYGLHNFSGVQASRFFGVPLVLEFNGPEVWVARHWGRHLRYEELADRIELLNLRAADVIVVVSRAIQAGLIDRGIPCEKILVNPNGVDPNRYSPEIDGSAVRLRHGLSDKTVIGFIGTFGRWHGAEVLAEAFGRLLHDHPGFRADVRLLMIGDGDRMPAVKAKLDELKVGAACVLTGLVPQEQGPMYLAACDLLVSPHVPNPDGSPFFGSPTKLFEYMAMGKGIVASDLDQIGEVLSHDVTAWLVPPGDVGALQQGLRFLLTDAARRQRLGDAARREVVAKYSWREHTRRITEAVKEQCG